VGAGAGRVLFDSTLTFDDIAASSADTTTVAKNGTPNADVSCTLCPGDRAEAPKGDLIRISGSALAQVRPRTRA
jgi:hypothetical protein